MARADWVSVRAKTGRVLLVAELAREYGFTDVAWRQVPAFELESASGGGG